MGGVLEVFEGGSRDCGISVLVVVVFGGKLILGIGSGMFWSLFLVILVGSGDVSSWIFGK